MIKVSDFQFKLFVFIAFALNLVLRLYKIDLSPLSYDESISAKDTLLNFGHIKHEAEWDSNPPFYHYCLWIWAKLFGISAFALRSFSALLCSVTMLISAFFFWKNYSMRSAVVFIVLFSLHPVIFYYSQEARCYSLLLLLASLTLISFRNFLVAPSTKTVAILGLLNFLLIYTHYITFYIPLFEVLIVVLFERSAIKWLSLSALLSLVLVFVRFTKGQFQLILGTSPNSSSRAWLKKATFDDLIHFMTRMYFHYILFILLVGFMVYLTYKNRYSDNSKKRTLQFLLLLSVVIPILHFIVGLYVPIFVDRYILYSVMFSLIMLSISVDYFRCSYVLVALFACFSAFNLKLTYEKDFDMRSVASYVKSNQNNRPVIIHTKDLFGLFTYYYDRQQFIKMDKNGDFHLENKKIYPARTLDDFKNLALTNEKSVLLFQGYDSNTLDQEIYSYYAQNGYTICHFNGFHGLKYVLFSKN
jgi:mannosyltransferase